MLIHVKQAFEVKNASGDKFNARNGDIIVPPEWVIHNDFFKKLCDSGKITVHMDSKSVELEQAKESEKAKEPVSEKKSKK